MGQTNQTVHMIMPSKDNLYYGRKGIGFENPSYFEKAKDLSPTLYDEKVIGLGYVNEKINLEDDYFQEIINPDFDKIDSPFQQISSLKPYVPNEKYAKLEAERYEYLIRYSAYFDNDKQHRKQIADQQVLFKIMSVQLVELDKHVRDLKNTMSEKDFKMFGTKGIGFENTSYFEKAKDLRPTLYDEK
nr:hypothetical protein [Tanacetum cinerariifolium]